MQCNGLYTVTEVMHLLHQVNEYSSRRARSETALAMERGEPVKMWELYDLTWCTVTPNDVLFEFMKNDLEANQATTARTGGQS